MDLNPQQFSSPEPSLQMIPVSRIGKMQAVNLHAVGKPGTVEDWYNDYRASGGRHFADEDMKKNGPNPKKPVSVGLAKSKDRADVLYDGHHRYAGARDAGITHLPAEVEESNYTAEGWAG